MENQICPICGKTFWIKHTGQVYCGRTCAAYGRAKQRQAPKPPKPKPSALSVKKECEYCGKVFTPRNGKQRYCGKKLRLERRERDEKGPIPGTDSGAAEESLSGLREGIPAAPQMADIRIMAEIPVYPELQPKVGAVYHAEVNDGGHNGQRFYVIQVEGKKVVVRKDECVEV